MAAGDLKLKEGRGGQLAQMWVESAGNGQLTTGTVEHVTALWCNAYGAVSITEPGGSAYSRTYYDGDQVCFASSASVTINSGTFSFMVA